MFTAKLSGTIIVLEGRFREMQSEFPERLFHPDYMTLFIESLEDVLERSM